MQTQYGAVIDNRVGGRTNDALWSFATVARPLEAHRLRNHLLFMEHLDSFVQIYA